MTRKSKRCERDDERGGNRDRKITCTPGKEKEREGERQLDGQIKIVDKKREHNIKEEQKQLKRDRWNKSNDREVETGRERKKGLGERNKTDWRE